MTKVNEFIDKNNINGTTKLSKKTPSLKITSVFPLKEEVPKQSSL
ncbi:hypothetical protein [Bathymodiolus japonicus methanotrophic gill symbiont]|nr:hypothetical protein [Bathymodiolus japonicus methanotrophic gill symbiont]